jgi:hypothetical protein
MAKEMKTLASIPTPSKVKEEPKALKTEVTPVVKGRFETLDKAVEYFKKEIDNIRGNVLKVYYEIGAEALSIKENAVYGKATVETFAERLEASPQIVYQYAQFAKKYTEAEFTAILTKDHVGWGAVMKLLSIEDKEVRTEFEDRLDSGDLAPSKLEEAIKEYKEDLPAPEKGEKAGSAKSEPQRNYVRNMQKMMGGLAIVQEYLPKAIKDVADIDQLEDQSDAREKVENVIHQVTEFFDAIWEDLVEFKDDATKAVSIPESKIKGKK